MTMRRFAMIVAAALLVQSTVFAWRYPDLLYFRQPVPALEGEQLEDFTRQATTALSRPSLTRRHLDTIADAASRHGQSQIEIEALGRRLALDPGDRQVRLRLADALRRAGEFSKAERLYLDALPTSGNEQP